MMNMYHLMGLGVTEACLCVFKGEYNSNHVQGVSKDVDWGSPVFFVVFFFSMAFYPDALMHSCTVRNRNVKPLSAWRSRGSLIVCVCVYGTGFCQLANRLL